MRIQFIITVSMLKLEKPTTAPARPAAALGQVSATLDHNVATLLVGVVKQIRLRLPRDQARCGRHFSLITQLIIINSISNFF